MGYLNLNCFEKTHAIITQFAFLEALFLEAIAQLKVYPKSGPLPIAKRWHEWLDKGSSGTSMGSNRVRFYDKVIKGAKEVFTHTVAYFQRTDRASRLEAQQQQLPAITMQSAVKAW